MDKIQSTLLKKLTGFSKRPIIIAYSGGVDSQVLLDGLSRLKTAKHLNNPLYVCHVNHGLSINAANWQQFAVEQCQQRAIELTICSVNITRQNQQSLEALSRDARYQALLNNADQVVNQLTTNQALIMTGHHSDDQLETFLLALKRGSGLKGLGAMASVSSLGEHLLLRPLLSLSRTEIEQYANEHSLTWVEDDSNSDTRFDRNFLRHKIIPLLKHRWSSINTTVGRSSDHCREAQQLLDELACTDLKSCLLENNSAFEPALKISELHSLSTARFNNLLRYFIGKQGYLMPSLAQLQQIKRQLTAATDKSPQIIIGEYCIRRFQEGLYLTKNFAELSDYSNVIDYSLLTLGNEQMIELPDGLGQIEFTRTLSNKNVAKNKNNIFITQPSENEKITVRFTHHNPKCLPDYRQHSRALKKILQELNIPPWQRKRIPFVFYNETLVAALGCFICKSFLVDKKQTDNKKPVIKINWLKL